MDDQINNKQIKVPITRTAHRPGGSAYGVLPDPAAQRAGMDKLPYWLFLLFAAYGPSINFMGQWRYVEIVLLALLFLNFGRALSYVGQLEKRLIWLFALAAGAHILSDFINEAAWQGTVKRAGTYLVLIAIIIAVQWISRNDPKRIAYILAGYCLSKVLLLFLGSSINEAYTFVPWRLGLGGAATLFLCVVIAVVPRFERFGGIALILLAGVHVAMNTRAMAGITAITGILVLVAMLQNRRFPPKFSPGFVVMIAVLSVVGVTAGMSGLKYGVKNNLFSEEMQQKMELQLSHPYGLLAAGRPQTLSAIYAISKRPIFGYGSGAYDDDVASFHSELIAMSFQDQDKYEQAIDRVYAKEFEHGLPSHSHLFGAWVDAGILAMVCWLAFFFLAVYVLARAMFWRHAWAPMFVLTSILTLWLILFSPGPERVDIAIKFMIMVYALHLFRGFDRAQDGGREIYS